MLRQVAILAAVVGAASAGGCGGAAAPPAGAPAAQPLGAQSTAPGTVGRITARDFRRPIATYRRHVGRELAAMAVDVGQLRAAVAAARLGAARAAWLRASARYGRIGAAYGAFGALDRAVDGTSAGLAGGTRSPRFVGLHRVELALWGRRSTRDAARPTRRLQRDVARMHARAARLRIEPLDYALRVHEILEDALHLDLAGRRTPWSASALVSLRSEVAGTEVVLGTLEPLLARRDPSGATLATRRALRALDAALSGIARPGDRLPRWDELARRARERIAGLTAAAAEQLAYLPELVDPRAPRAKQAPLRSSR